MFGLLALILTVGAANAWWVNRQARAVGVQVAALARPGDIRMLSSDSCSVCVVARTWFTQNRVAYSECSIEQDAVCRVEYESLRLPGTPVIVVRGRPQLGFSVEKLRQALQPAG